MNAIPPNAILEATRLTRAGRLTEASALLRDMLGRAVPPATASAGGEARRVFDIDPDAGETCHPAIQASARGQAGTPSMASGFQGFLNRIGQGGPAPARRPPMLDEEFLHGRFSSAGAARDYRLFRPAIQLGTSPPLIVMLHGCTQSPEDFAAGTQMNALAEANGCLVAYPRQPQSANAQKCWNWFSPADQQRDRGEPALIAGITRQIIGEHAVDPRRVYIAGLSAGGAAAAIMGQAYPEIYAAVGVHSGLACGAARDVPSAFAAMRQGAPGSNCGGIANHIVPAIVFHADGDGTVHPRNADEVIAQFGRHGRTEATSQRGQVPGGHAYTRTIHADAQGHTLLEQWLIHGAGHAWSGGSAAGSHTDPRGPDASREMLRFFLQHPRAAAPRCGLMARVAMSAHGPIGGWPRRQ